MGRSGSATTPTPSTSNRGARISIVPAAKKSPGRQTVLSTFSSPAMMDDIAMPPDAGGGRSRPRVAGSISIYRNIVAQNSDVNRWYFRERTVSTRTAPAIPACGAEGGLVLLMTTIKAVEGGRSPRREQRYFGYCKYFTYFIY